MTGSTKSAIRITVVSICMTAILGACMLYLEAWGDERYVLKGEARAQAISEMNVQIDIQETEILFAESERVKEKHRAIKAKIERAKEELEKRSII